MLKKEYLNHLLTYKKELPYLFRHFLFTFLQKKKARSYGGIDLGVKNLLKDGCLLLPEKALKREVACNLRDYILAGPKVSKYDRSGVLLRDTYDQSHLIKNDFILKLATDNDILTLAANYFESQPKVAFIASWTTYADDPEDLGEMYFHMDHHGHKFLKMFYYLTDVDEGDGHHEYVSKTTDHILNNGKLASWRKTMPDLAREYEKKRRLKGSYKVNEEVIHNHLQDDILKIYGKAGSCFIEDTYGLHRGTPIKNASLRTILQVCYAPKVHEKDPKNISDTVVDNNTVVKKHMEVFDELLKNSKN